MRKIYCTILVIVGLTAISCQPKTEKESKAKKKEDTFAQLDLSVPEWAKDVVWYQIFVERFRNGDTTNDPRPEDIEGSYPGYIPENWKITPWTQDWYKEDEYFASIDTSKTDFGGNKIQHFGQKVQLRRYGGDLQGVIDKIDYLDSLGITAIYFNPLNDAPSMHKYDARNWRHIDRNFGPTPQKDAETMAAETPDDPTTWKMTGADKMFVKLVKKLHERGIRVIIDYSWNHTGHTCWAFQDLKEKGSASKYADWYIVKSFDNPETEENEFSYKGWFGVHELPEIKETVKHESNIIQAYEGNLFSKAVKNHIYNVSKRWLDPNGDGDISDGVDGFRLDVAAEIGLEFWREYRQFVRNINPKAYLLGEVWWEKWPEKLIDPEPFLKGDVFDAVMNYRWYKAAREFFNRSPKEIPVSQLVENLQSLMSNLSKEHNYAMMNMSASHDAPRILTSLYNKNKYKFHTKPQDNKEYKINKPDKETYKTLKLMLVHQFTYIGAPQIWAGDEMGMWGADDPSTRKPLIWSDLNFEPETRHPLALKRPTDEVKFNEKLFSFYQKLIKIRKKNPVLTKGDMEYILVDDKNKTLAYSRFNKKQEEVVAIFNTSSEEKTIKIPLKTKQGYYDALAGLKTKQEKDNLIQITIPARNSAILIAKTDK